MLNIMNQIAAVFAKLPASGSECRSEDLPKIAGQRLSAERAEPDDRQAHEENGGHEGRGEHGPRHVAILIDRFADVTGRRLERRSAQSR